MYHPTTTTLTPEQIRENLISAYGYLQRARRELRKARTEAESDAAAWWIKNASGEIARWSAAWKAARP